MDNLVGDAFQFDNRLRLTGNTRQERGTAWFTAKQLVSEGFDTRFEFELSDGTGVPSDGLTFAIQNFNDSFLGPAGGFLAYDGLPNSVVVEFDTFPNRGGGFNFKDPNGHHISVHTRGTEPNTVHESASIGSTLDIPPLGGQHRVQISYRPGSMSVFIDDMINPRLNVSIDLAATLQLDNGTAWVGFTAATGGGTQNHDLLNWSFQSVPEPTTLTLFVLLGAVVGSRRRF